MSSLSLINPKADLVRAQFALQVNTSAARALQDILSSNLGPRGTMKMLVSGGGEIKITKDGSVLLSEMVAFLIMNSANTASYGLINIKSRFCTREMLRQAELLTVDGMHPSFIVSGFDTARDESLKLLSKWAKKIDVNDREMLKNVARTSLSTKVNVELIPILADVVVDAILCVKKSEEIDLHMIEIMQMLHKSDIDTRLIKGLVMDHGGRHPNMPKIIKNAYILTCNVSLEYEKSEVNAGYFYKTTEERLKMVAGERKFTDDKVRKIIELKKYLCEGTDKGFVVIDQKGIDPISLSMLAEAGILALRRAKRRNMERIVEACGGVAINSLEDLSSDVLGYAGSVSEFLLGEEKYTFVEETPLSGSITILINGPTKFCLTQIKDALRDGLRAVNNAVSDGIIFISTLGCLLPGGGAIEIALSQELIALSKNLNCKEQMGVAAFASALLIIPRTLAKNAGLDPQDAIVKLTAGNAVDMAALGVFDNLVVKKQILTGCTSIACNLLLVDEIVRAGVSTMKQQQ
ncbi:hypothetical protein MXB_797 [Myxobolus squamalis]|nr:hypothetical protein MXB_797 [Myxobolus squamalis]